MNSSSTRWIRQLAFPAVKIFLSSLRKARAKLLHQYIKQCKRLQKFGTFSDFLLFINIGVALILVPVLLSFWKLPEILRFFDRKAKLENSVVELTESPLSNTLVEKSVFYVDFWVGFLHIKKPCLPRALVLFARYRRAGIPVIFCLGIRTSRQSHNGEVLQGHAWLELNNTAICEPQDKISDYVRTFYYPASTAPTK